MYHIAQNFDGENADRFDAQLAIRQNFSFQYFFNYIATSYRFSKRLSINIFPVKLLNEANPLIFPLSKFCAIWYYFSMEGMSPDTSRMLFRVCFSYTHSAGESAYTLEISILF